MTKCDSFDGRDAISQSTIKTLVYEFFFSAYQPSEFFLRHFPRACDFTSIPSGKYNKNFIELSFSSEKSLFRIETNSERTILILPFFFFFVTSI